MSLKGHMFIPLPADSPGHRINMSSTRDRPRLIAAFQLASDLRAFHSGVYGTPLVVPLLRLCLFSWNCGPNKLVDGHLHRRLVINMLTKRVFTWDDHWGTLGALSALINPQYVHLKKKTPRAKIERARIERARIEHAPEESTLLYLMLTLVVATLGFIAQSAILFR